MKHETISSLNVTGGFVNNSSPPPVIGT